MSYNVTKEKSLRMKDFEVPFELLLKLKAGEDIRLKKLKAGDGHTIFELSETVFIKGIIVGDYLQVTEFECRGECSGWAYDQIFEVAFKESRGEFQITRVWEGGDHIDILSVQNGAVKSTEIIV